MLSVQFKRGLKPLLDCGNSVKNKSLFLLFSSVVLLVDELLAALSEAVHSVVQGLQQTLQLLLPTQQTVNTIHRVLQAGEKS